MRVAAGDLDNNGDDEVIVVEISSSRLKVYDYDYINRVMTETGVDYKAYFTQKANVSICAGDVDADGYDEIITVSNFLKYRNPVLKVWDVDTLGGIGSWAISLQTSAIMGLGEANSIEAYDLEGDGKEEILMLNNREVKIANNEGTELGVLITGDNGMSDIGIGDVNCDGDDEVVIGYERGTLKTYDINGNYIGEFSAFITEDRIRVSIGNFPDCSICK